MYETYYQDGKQQKNMKRVVFPGENGVAIQHYFSLRSLLEQGTTGIQIISATLMVERREVANC